MAGSWRAGWKVLGTGDLDPDADRVFGSRLEALDYLVDVAVQIAEQDQGDWWDFAEELDSVPDSPNSLLFMAPNGQTWYLERA